MIDYLSISILSNGSFYFEGKHPSNFCFIYSIFISDCDFYLNNEVIKDSVCFIDDHSFFYLFKEKDKAVYVLFYDYSNKRLVLILLVYLLNQFLINSNLDPKIIITELDQYFNSKINGVFDFLYLDAISRCIHEKRRP